MKNLIVLPYVPQLRDDVEKMLSFLIQKRHHNEIFQILTLPKQVESIVADDSKVRQARESRNCLMTDLCL